MSWFSMSPYAFTMASIGLRSTQVLCSLISLATLAASFASDKQWVLIATAVNDVYSMKLGSHEANFMLLTTYSSMMYALWYVSVVEVFPLVARPRPCVSRTMDGVMALFLFCGALALACSDYVAHCDVYGAWIRCHNIKTAVAFGFLALLPFGGSIALTFVTQQETPSTTTPSNNTTQAPYMVEATPTGALSPLGVAPTPSQKV